MPPIYSPLDRHNYLILEFFHTVNNIVPEIFNWTTLSQINAPVEWTVLSLTGTSAITAGESCGFGGESIRKEKMRMLSLCEDC